VTVAVLIGVIVMHQQLKFLQNKELGYNKTNLISIRMNRKMTRQYETVKQKLLANPHIVNASATANLPTRLQSGTVVQEWEGKTTKDQLHFKLLWVDSDYLDTFGLKMTEGRFFSKERSTDPHGFVINETAVKEMGLDSPVGKRAVINRTEGIIIGVVKDFHFRSLHHAIEPAALLYEPATFYTMVIKLRPGVTNEQECIRYIESVWKELSAEDPFIYTFFEDTLRDLYKKEEIQSRLITYFSVLALFIACLGLLGIVSLTLEQRTKEIGIRKVLGASTQGLIVMLLKEFMKWVFIANITAWPVAYWIMSRWLQKYAYHTSLSPLVFFTASLIALTIALFTVIYQTFRTSLTNPVDSLRFE
jgi:putative ABC transport system permease protein